VLKAGFEKSRLDASLTGGIDGFSGGGQIIFEHNGTTVELKEYNVGAEYSQNDVTASVYTDKDHSNVNVALYQKPTANQVLAALFKYNLAKKTRALTLGVEHRVDVDTSVRAKVDLPDGTIGAVVEQRLNNPLLLLQIAAQFATKPVLVSQKLGVTVAFGDF